MNLNIFKEIETCIKNSRDIVITTHINPDGDGIGAGIALFLGLNKYIKDNQLEMTTLRFVIEDEVPKNLEFLFASEMIEKLENYSSKRDLDLLIAVDTASAERMGKVLALGGKIINIDHHVSNTKYGDINYIDSTSPSTAEIIYEFLKAINIDFDINMCEGIYTGIVNDTGNFKHSNVTEKTFLIASELIAQGVDNTKIIREFRDRKTYSALKIYGRALEKSQYFPEEKLIYTYLTREDLKEFGGNKFDTEGVVEFILQCDMADTSLFLREEENGTIKGSMRTKKNDVDLNVITGYFNGGGHKKAAGFSSRSTCDEIIKKIIEIL